jgi:hypothetical protein
MSMELTSDLAYAAATDAANANMRSHKRKAWSEDDFNVAARTKARLLGYCSECCMDLPQHWFTCSQATATLPALE